MTITASMVKALRDRTGAGMMECKKALTEADGDMEAAVAELRKKSLAKADKKAGRIAAEGVVRVALSDDATSGVLVEINCETDFVAKDENFMDFAEKVAATVLHAQPDGVEALSAMPIAGGQQSVEEARVELFSKVGENISIRRFGLVKADAGQKISSYIHGTRIGVLVRSEGGRDDLGRDVAMHIAASKPVCVSQADVPADTLEQEREIFKAQAVESGKPEHIAEKMVEGRIKKYLNEVTLLGQPFVKDPDQSIEKLLNSEQASVQEFLRFEVGEGIARKEDDFVAEVMAQAKGA